MKNLLTLSVLSAFSFTAFAEAPFCVRTSYGKNCWYYTASECKKAAAREDGACIANPNSEDSSSSSYSNSYSNSRSNNYGAPFCVRTSYGDNCFYYSASECQRAAAREDGACISK